MEEAIDSSHFESKYVSFSQKCTFNILECHFPPGFLAEGRRGQTKKLENTFSKFIMPFFIRIFRRRPPRTNKTTCEFQYGNQYGN